MKLFKYVDSKRIDILQNKKIRFTQPLAWNDPFEMKPYYEGYEKNNPFYFIQKITEFYQKHKKGEEISEKEIQEFEAKRTYNDISIENLINGHIVALSLTEKKDNLLMWSHYASNHTGFVIEFDTNHSFFKDRKKYLFKIKYGRKRPIIKIEEFYKDIENLIKTLLENNLGKLNEFEKEFKLIFKKSIEWKYEDEWRLLTTVENASNYSDIEKDINNLKIGLDSKINENLNYSDHIALFDIPISSIRTIYFGKRMQIKLVRKIIKIINNNSEFSHINLLCSELCEKEYKLVFKRIEPLSIYTFGEIEKMNKREKISIFGKEVLKQNL